MSSDASEIDALLRGDSVLQQLKAISDLRLCDRCLGRLFSKRFRGTENAAIGERARCMHGIPETMEVDCYLCHGLFKKMDELSKLPVDELGKWEYDTLWVGSRLEFGARLREQEITARSQFTDAEPLKVEVNRELGKRLSSLTGKEGKMTNPDMLVVIDVAFSAFQLEPSSLFVYGRYRKLVRGIPQTKWPCRKCHGKGCSHCNFKGKMYDTSVEELIAPPLMNATAAEEHFFHGMGREDIDAIMLGNGRPFIMELSKPHVRKIDLVEVGREINAINAGRVDVSDLRFSSKAEVRELKAASPVKRYRITFRALGKINKQLLCEVITKLSGTKLSQRTPLRVAHRRADLVRERTVLECKLIDMQDDAVTLEVEAESGTYIKELITGDGGRTVPSVSQGLGMECQVISLDVSEVSTGVEGKW